MDALLRWLRLYQHDTGPVSPPAGNEPWTVVLEHIRSLVLSMLCVLTVSVQEEDVCDAQQELFCRAVDGACSPQVAGYDFNMLLRLSVVLSASLFVKIK